MRKKFIILLPLLIVFLSIAVPLALSSSVVFAQEESNSDSQQDTTEDLDYTPVDDSRNETNAPTNSPTQNNSALLNTEEIQSDCPWNKPWTWGNCLAEWALNKVHDILILCITLAAWFLEIIISVNTEIIATPVVQKGFATSLGVVNIGFVIAIIVIAIATILQRETYGIKQTLWKLVVAALLVNFSLAIGGIIISTSDALTTNLMNMASNGGGISSLSEGIINSQKTVGLSGAQTDKTAAFLSPSGTPGKTDTFTELLFALLLSIVVLALTFLSLMAIVVMMLARYIILSFLLVVAPFAWLMWMFGSGLWKSWWQQFVRWTFFAPIMIFFIVLVINSFAPISTEPQNTAGAQEATTSRIADPFITKITEQAANSGSQKALGGLQIFFKDFFSSTAQFMIAIGFLFGGLIIANKFSIFGANKVLGAAKAMTKAAPGGMWRGGVKTASKITQGGTWLANKVRPGLQRKIQDTANASIKRTDSQGRERTKLDIAKQTVQKKAAEFASGQSYKGKAGLTKTLIGTGYKGIFKKQETLRGKTPSGDDIEFDADTLRRIIDEQNRTSGQPQRPNTQTTSQNRPAPAQSSGPTPQNRPAPRTQAAGPTIDIHQDVGDETAARQAPQQGETRRERKEREEETAAREELNRIREEILRDKENHA